ncbi:MAG: hypothetical protein ABSA83_05200 [Verrucomicrobiota bacterium]|jgi:hypothetical protein
MARNKRNESAVRPGSILTALAVCVLFVTLSVGYLWYKDQIDLLGHQIKDRENRLAELQRQNKMRRDQLATLCSPVALDARVKKLNLGLGPPAKSQVIWMVEAPLVEQTAGQPSQDQRQAQAGSAERKN